MDTTIIELTALYTEGNAKERGAAIRAACMVRSGQATTTKGKAFIGAMVQDVPALKKAFPSLY